MASSGLVLVNKPTGMTSHDVVARARKLLGTKKIGHAGTLDPLATGLLVLGVESGTKLLTFLVGADKTYLATIRLGQSTISDDSQSEVISIADPQKLSALKTEEIREEISKLTGDILQRPSSVSAVKVGGKRAYDLVRSGEEVELKHRAVKIYSFEVLQESVTPEGFIDLSVRVDCSSGTYIRALARDLGAALGVYGHITSLQRTRVGSFNLDSASDLENLSEADIIPLAKAARDLMPARELLDTEVTDLVHGKQISRSSNEPGLLAGISSANKLIAVLEPTQTGLKSVVVFQGELND